MFPRQLNPLLKAPHPPMNLWGPGSPVEPLPSRRGLPLRVFALFQRPLLLLLRGGYLCTCYVSCCK
jgi:hypothetical protein